mmetsp:Transcript_3728/g.8626  ORF Transcript_3728/g.8626 Transcript_3728/m.8626 type:complete len:313 (+) Transcript_3728:982-1920(+)
MGHRLGVILVRTRRGDRMARRRCTARTTGRPTGGQPGGGILIIGRRRMNLDANLLLLFIVVGGHLHILVAAVGAVEIDGLRRTLLEALEPPLGGGSSSSSTCGSVGLGSGGGPTQGPVAQGVLEGEGRGAAGAPTRGGGGGGSSPEVGAAPAGRRGQLGPPLLSTMPGGCRRRALLLDLGLGLDLGLPLELELPMLVPEELHHLPVALRDSSGSRRAAAAAGHLSRPICRAAAHVLGRGKGHAPGDGPAGRRGGRVGRRSQVQPCHVLGEADLARDGKARPPEQILGQHVGGRVEVEVDGEGVGGGGGPVGR